MSIALDNPSFVGTMRQAVSDAQPKAITMKTVGLPGFVRWFFQIFALVIYGPDMYFSYQIYTKNGELVAGDIFHAAPAIILFATLSAGTVGMAYLLSVLAPFHWRKDHRAIALTCGIGVLIATAVTILFSLAYRSENPVTYAFDDTLRQWIGIKSISPIQFIAAFAPPFWGLFWAIVQPTDTKSEAEIAADDPDAVAKIQHKAMVQTAQIEAASNLAQAKAAANAVNRGAQLKGLISTAREATQAVQQQIAPSPIETASTPPEAAQSIEESIPAVTEQEVEVTEDVIGVPVMSNNVAPQTEAAVYAPKPDSKAFRMLVRSTINQIAAQGVKPTVDLVAEQMNETTANVAPIFDEIRAVKTTRY